MGQRPRGYGNRVTSPTPLHIFPVNFFVLKKGLYLDFLWFVRISWFLVPVSRLAFGLAL